MKRSALALIGSLVGLVYLTYLGYALVTMANPRIFTLRAVGFEMQVAFLLPYALMTAVAVLLHFIAFAARKRGAVLATAILYCAAVPLSPSLMPSLFPVSLALALLALIEFLRFPARTGKGQPVVAEPDPALEMLDEPVPGEADVEAMELDKMDDSADLEDDADLALDDDADDDLQLEPLPDDEEPEKRHPSRSGADGMTVFLGLFMGLAALALIGMVIYGVTGGKLPFLP